MTILIETAIRYKSSMKTTCFFLEKTRLGNKHNSEINVDCRNGNKEAIYSVENTSVSGDEATRILYLVSSFN